MLENPLGLSMRSGKSLGKQLICAYIVLLIHLKDGFSQQLFLLISSVPHYHIVSRKVEAGRFSAAVNYLRKFLVEDIYHRFGERSFPDTRYRADGLLVTMFPETANWQTSADE